MRAVFHITERGRAADGRRLAARAVLIQLILVWILFAILGAMEISAGNDITSHSQSVVMTCVFYLFVLFSLARGWIVVGILYGLYALVSFFFAFNMKSFGTLYALGGIVFGILNFVAVCGIVIWLRNRNSTSSNIAYGQHDP